MTPKERADAYWHSYRGVRGCDLEERFKKCENDALERASAKVIEDCKGWDIGEKESYTPLWITKAVKVIEGCKL